MESREIGRGERIPDRFIAFTKSLKTRDPTKGDLHRMHRNGYNRECSSATLISEGMGGYVPSYQFLWKSFDEPKSGEVRMPLERQHCRTLPNGDS